MLEYNSNQIQPREETETKPHNVNEKNIMDRARADGLDKEKCDILCQITHQFRNEDEQVQFLDGIIRTILLLKAVNCSISKITEVRL